MKYKVNDRGDPRKYFAMIPHIIDDMGLSVYAYRLYGHLKRVAGDNGKCWQSTRTLADECKMSMGKVSDAKRELETKGLIKISEEKTERGGKDSHVITITDIWSMNMAKYKASSQDEQPSSGDELASSPHERTSSPGEIKNNTLRKNNEEKYPQLKDSAFTEAWTEWEKYRKQRHKKLTPMTVKRQLNKLGKYDTSTAIAMIEQSIEHGWIGLFEVENNGKKETPKGYSAA